MPSRMCALPRATISPITLGEIYFLIIPRNHRASRCTTTRRSRQPLQTAAVDNSEVASSTTAHTGKKEDMVLSEVSYVSVRHRHHVLKLVPPILLVLSFHPLFCSYRVGAVAPPHVLGQPFLGAEVDRSSFPAGFLFGAGTAAYEVEGAAYEGCKGISTWDVFTHEHPEAIMDRSNGDIAIDSYHRYKEDIDLLKEMGMDAYRFSISWARILPNGSLSGGICQDGIQYYNDLIDYMVDKGLQPFVTLLHAEFPQILLTKYLGFLSPEFIKDFRDFVNICFREFGDRVKHWTTINEPSMLAEFCYSLGHMPPQRCSPCLGLNCAAGNSCTEPYIAVHNLLLAHAAVVHLYRDNYQGHQNGQIGVTLISSWLEPYSNYKLDYEAVSRAQDFTLGWFLDPLTFGDYPFVMRALVGDRLPKLSQSQSSLVKGSFDFIGINYYASANIQSVSVLEPIACCSYESDSYTVQSGRRTNPRGLEDILLYIKEKYNDPAIYITENGIGQANKANISLQEALKDEERIEYHKSHLYFLHKAVARGANVKGYFVWSLIDSFQWNFGFTRRFGVIYVDYEGNLKRYPKKSFNWFQAFLIQQMEEKKSASKEKNITYVSSV